MSAFKMPDGMYPALVAETYYKDPSIGSTLQKLLLPDKPPLDFWYSCPWLNTAAPLVEEKKEALMFGNGMHMLLFEPDRFKATFTIKDGVEKSLIPNHLGEGQFEMMLAMRTELLNYKTLAKLVLGGKAEVSMFWTHESGAPCRGRIDFLKASTMVDYKAVQEVSVEAIARMVSEYGYDMQAASYLDGLKRTTGRDDGNVVYLFQEKKPPFKVMAVAFDDAIITEGKSKYDAAMQRYVNCLEMFGKKRWEGYPDTILDLTPDRMPKWWSGNNPQF